MKKIPFAVLLILIVSISVSACVVPGSSQTQRKALVISSVNKMVPMRYYAQLTINYLKNSGYNVTFLTDNAVKVDFLLNHLNDYDVVIWRTNTYTWAHEEYWYVGERTNAATELKYASDFAAGWLNDRTGVIGFGTAFATNHFSVNALGHIKLIVLISSDGDVLAPELITAGVSSVIFCNGHISLQFGLIDDLTTLLTSYLASGESVFNSVYDTVSPFNNAKPKDPLDSSYAPPFWFAGNGALTIA
jgi:hypothetical protein